MCLQLELPAADWEPRFGTGTAQDYGVGAGNNLVQVCSSCSCISMLLKRCIRQNWLDRQLLKRSRRLIK